MVCVPIFPITRRCEQECCTSSSIPGAVQKAKPGHRFQVSTVGEGCAMEHIMFDRGDERTETNGANLLFVTVITSHERNG